MSLKIIQVNRSLSAVLWVDCVQKTTTRPSVITVVLAIAKNYSWQCFFCT